MRALWIRIPSGVLLLSLLFLGAWHCDVLKEVEPTQDCRSLREQLQRDDHAQHRSWEPVRELLEKQPLSGCVQLSYGDSGADPASWKAVSVPIRHGLDGGLYARCSDSDAWDCRLELRLPASADGKQLRMRVFLWHPQAANTPQLCAQAKEEPAFSCLDHAGCLMSMEFQAAVEGYTAAPVSPGIASNGQCSLWFRQRPPQEPASELRVEPPSPEPRPESAPDDGGQPDASEPLPEPAPEPLPDRDCVSGSSRPCYTGPPQHRGKGACKEGRQACVGGSWGPCVGAVLPRPEGKCDAIDDDCDGAIDDCAWLAHGGTKAHDEALALALGPKGSGFVTGFLGGAAKPSFGSLSLPTTSGTFDSYVARFDSQGQWRQLAVIPGRSSRDDRGLAIAVNASSFAFVVGHFGGVLSFPGGALTSIANGGTHPPNDGYIAVLSPQFRWVAASSIGTSGHDRITDIALHRPSGRIFVCGVLERDRTKTPAERSFSYGTSSSSLGAAYDAAVFVAELEFGAGSRLGWKWLKLALQWKSGAGFGSGARLALGAGGKLLLVAPAPKGSVEIMDKAETLAGNGQLLALSLSPSAAGVSLDWRQQITGASSFQVGAVAAYPKAASGPDRFAIVGTYAGAAQAGGLSLPASRGEDAFVAALEDKGTTGQWLWATSSGARADDRGFSVAVDGQGGVAVGGLFSSATPTTWGGLPILGAPVCGGGLPECPIVARLDAQGRWQWAIGAGSTRRGGIHGLQFDGQGQLFFAGSSASRSFAGLPLSGLLPSLGEGHVIVGKDPRLLLKP